ncbi:GDSL esterase/lipase At3g48460 [Nymphaea colorata]|nr:GDSL esterase/lipase At3g48460 [Nymphaea colorata]
MASSRRCPVCPPFLLIVMVLLGFPPLTPLAAAPALPRGCFSKIFAFGDSYTDTGNTDSMTGPSAFQSVSNLPYGETFFHRPTNRYSDGRLVVDFLAQALGHPLLPPYLHSKQLDRQNGANFAYAGSTALDYDFYVKNNVTFDLTNTSLQTQLHWFSSFLESSGGRAVDVGSALFWVGEIGANDYAYSYFSSVPYTTIRTLAIKNTADFLQALLSKGAKYIVVQGLPLLGCLPLTMFLAPNDERDQFGCVKNGNARAYEHNSLLLTKIQALRAANPDAVIVYADYANAHRRILEHSRLFGFEELISTCCGSGGPQNFDITATCGSGATSMVTSQKAKACANPRAFIIWDGVHFTEAMNNALWDLFSGEGYCSPTLDALFIKKRCTH